MGTRFTCISKEDLPGDIWLVVSPISSQDWRIAYIPKTSKIPGMLMLGALVVPCSVSVAGGSDYSLPICRLRDLTIMPETSKSHLLLL